MDALTARGVPIEGAVVSPAIRIVGLGPKVKVASDTAAVFTSRHAVTRTEPSLGAVAYCVGDATAQAAQSQGYVPIIAGGTADDLLERLLKEPPKQKLVYCHGTHVQRDLVQPLRQAHITIDAHCVYDQPACRPTKDAIALLAGQEPIVLPLFSARTAEIVAKWSKDSGARIYAVALSAAVAKNWDKQAVVVKKPSLAAMVDAVSAHYTSQGNG